MARNGGPVDLARDFPVLGHTHWQELAAKALNRGRPDDRKLDGAAAEEMLRSVTVDDLVIAPLYELEGEVPDLGRPGFMPFTRGIGLRDPHNPWDVRQRHDNPDPAAARDEIRSDLEGGVTSVWLQVGNGGLAADDVASALEDVHLDLAGVVVSGDPDQGAAADALLEVWRLRGIAPEAARGNLGIDPLAAAMRAGVPSDMDAVVDPVRRCLNDHPGVRALTVDVTSYHDAGAGDVDEVSLAVATGIEYVRTLDNHGVGAADAFAQIEFRIAVTADQFTTIAKLRALRRLWARVGEACDVPEAGRGAVIHAVTSARMLSRDDPWVNILRTTVATFAAACGGAQAITVLPFDAEWGQSDDLARRLARNTHILLAEESSLGRVTDPAGGSWYVESLTGEIAAAAWAWVQRLEADGGVGAAGERVRARIADRVRERDRRLATRDQSLTGVSMFPNPAEPPLTRVPRRRTDPPGLPIHRDAAMFEALRDRARAAADRGAPPTALLVCLGERRDFGAREDFTANVLGVAGFTVARVEGADPTAIADAVRGCGARIAILCSNARNYAAMGANAAAVLREAGVGTVLIAGRRQELGDDETAVDGSIHAGMDVVEALTGMLDDLGVPR